MSTPEEQVFDAPDVDRELHESNRLARKVADAVLEEERYAKARAEAARRDDHVAYNLAVANHSKAIRKRIEAAEKYQRLVNQQEAE